MIGKKCEELERVKDQIRAKLDTYLTQHGIKNPIPGRMFTCISHKPDKHPSCNIIKGSPEMFHCFSCLEESEPILTVNGLQEIGDVKIGQSVWDKFGKIESIIGKRYLQKRVTEVVLDNCSDGLKVTTDHPFLYVKKSDAIDKLPYLRSDKGREIKFYGRMKNNKRCYKSHPNNPIKIELGETSSMNVGDYLLFPIIKDEFVDSLDGKSVIKPYTHGPKTPRVESIPVTECTARLFGLWLAEGSTSSQGRNVVFTFNLDEEYTLAQEVQATLESLSLTSSKHTSEQHHTCTIVCSKVDFARILEHWFGCGASNKRIPGVCYRWPSNLKKAILKGYIDGDGYKGNRPVTISKELAYGIRTLAIQLQYPVSMRLNAAHVDKNGIYHKDAWSINILARENSTAFFEEIEGVLYFWSSIKEIVDNKEVANVVDIEVSGSHTFISKLGVVHNCGVTGDIFTAAHYLDGKPLEGPTFITENVADLAMRFGIPMPENFMDMTEDEKEELKTFAAYRSAMQILISGDEKTRSKIVDERLKSYKWTEDTMQLLGVGWVTDYQNYWKRMLALGYSANFLRQVDLDNRGIFNEHSIIFTIKDEFGNPVGFSARNLEYEEKSKEYDAIVAKEGKDSPQLVGRSAPRKYINSTQLDGDTKPKNRIYQKGTRLYNLCVAKKHTPPLWIFEGYSDTTTAANESMFNTVAVGSVSFRREQLELILATNQKHLIYVLDADAAGAEGTSRFMKLLETELGDRPGLKVEVVAMPAGSDDPDAFIRKNGRKAFESLERMDAFDWKVKQDLASGLDKHDVCNHGVSLIVNEPNRILQYKKACQLAKHCGIPESAVWPQVLARVDQDQAKLSAERLALTNQVAKELTKNPGAVVSILKDAETRLENLEKIGRGYDKKSVDNYTSYLFDSYEKNNSKMDLITGWHYFDNMLGGIPTGDSFITVPGKMNQGKCLRMAARLKTVNGWKLMKDIKVGDLMASVDGEKSYVTGVFPQGIKKAYKVTLVDGRSITCCDEHLWKVKFCQQYAKGYGDGIHNGWKVLNTEAIRTFCLNKDKKSRHKEVFIPVVDGSFGTSDSLPLDPWLLGVLLGDGSLMSSTPVLTSADKEIVDRVGQLIAPLGLIPKWSGKYDWRLSGNHAGRCNHLSNLLNTLGLQGKDCFTKFIPEEYLLSNRANRVALLQGLMDTDGTIGKTKETSFTSCSKQLAEGVQQLVWSLGGVASISTKKKTFTYKGEKKVGALAYQVNIRISDKKELFSLQRKRERAGDTNRRPLLLIKNIEYVGEEEMQCISVSHPSNLYITDNYIVTHNTSLLANLQVRLLENNENITVFAHSLDDALGWYIPRLLGVRYGFPSTWFRKYGYYGKNEGKTKLDNRTSMKFSDSILGLTFEEAWRQGRTWLNNLIDKEELILADASVLPGTMPAFESWVRVLRSKYPDRRLVCCGDNFHIYDLPGVEDGERKTRLMSQYIKGMANRYHTTVIMTMELPKESLRPGLRPRVGNIKGTSGVAYDSNMNIGVYNDMKDFPADPKLIWYNSKQPSMTLVKSEVCQSVGAASPVLELVFDKVKTGSSFCGSLFYDFDPESGAMAECRESDQLSMQVKANEPDQRSWKQNPPSNFGRFAPDRTL